MATTAITRRDIVALGTYRQGREEYLRKMIAYKKNRRIKLNPDISLLFENRNTVLFQIQELVNSEDLEDANEIQEYIDIYAPMIPEAGQLSATLFIEKDDQEKLTEMLVQLKGIEHHLTLVVEGEKVAAVFEEEHDDREFTTSVHYLKFPLTNTAYERLVEGDASTLDVHVVLGHPNLQADVKLSPEMIASLAKDLHP
ncbi:MAG TPA: DUF3501 family protein [Bacilli bacterium]|nr:DUF3501 family protein [Bacilli bacterium]